jgi:hypothetical protein
MNRFENFGNSDLCPPYIFLASGMIGINEVSFFYNLGNYSAKKVVYIAREKLITVHDNAANERTAPGTDRTRS